MVNQETIFSHALGFYPNLHQRYKSPFRPDKHGDCFVRWKSGWLRWVDWAEPRHNWANCWDILAIAKWGHKIQNQDQKDEITQEIRKISGPISLEMPETQQFHMDLRAEKVEWSFSKLKYWLDYGIVESNLRDDKTYQIKSYSFNSEKFPDEYRVIVPKDLAFVYEYDKNIKIYRPEQNIRYLKWMTNCNHNDVSLEDRSERGDLLLFEGYKDARSIKNLGFNTRGLQSSTQIPDEIQLSIWDKQFNNIYLVFDPDAAGKRNAVWAKKQMEKFGINAGISYIDTDLDPAAFRKKYGRDKTRKLINHAISNSIFDSSALSE